MAVFKMRAKNRSNVHVISLGLVRAQKGIYTITKVYPSYARTMLDVAETRGFALSMPMAEKV